MILNTHKLVFRNLFRYQSRNLLTGLSISLGTAAIILGLSMTDGIIHQTIIGFTGTLFEDIMIRPINSTVIKEFRKTEEVIYTLEGVDYITKKIQFMGNVFSESSSVQAQIMGMEPEGIRRKTNLKMVKGRYLNNDDRMSLIISEKLAARLNIDVGDKVAIVTNTPSGGMNAKDLNVAGIFSVITGLQFVDHLIYVSIWDTQDLMGLEDGHVFSLGVYIHDVDSVDSYKVGIAEELKKNGQNYHVLSWKEAMSGLLAQYYFLKRIIFVFTVILFLIICIGVINSVFLSIGERTREIGTIMALGGKRKAIVFLFMMEGTVHALFFSIVGCLVGVGLTLLLESLGIQAFSKGTVWLFGGKVLHPYLKASSVFLPFCFVVSSTLVGILYPVFKASRLDPLKALSHV